MVDVLTLFVRKIKKKLNAGCCDGAAGIYGP